MTHTLAQRIGAPDFLGERRAYYGVYTICFAAFAIACFAVLYATGHCLIWKDDGIDQHFAFFCYFGTWMREAIATGTLPQWDFSLGYGSDIVCTLASWIGEPFNLLSILCPEQYSEYLYQALVVARLYLVGIAFSAYCRYHGREGFATLLGALAYAFSGFCLVWGAFRHTMFIDPAILLPWVLLGADKVLDGKRPTVLLIALATTFISYFYFAYMIAIFLVLYCLLRYFGEPRERSVRDLLALVGRFALYACVAAAVAGFLLAPIVPYVLQMGRLSADSYVETFLTLGGYLLYPLTLAGGDSSMRGLPMEAVAVFCLAVLLFAPSLRKKPELKQVRIAFVALFVFTLFPVFGSIFNGFSYSTDRWMFAFAMCVSYAITLVVPHIAHLDNRDWKVIGIVFAVFAVDALGLLLVWFNKVWILVALACLVATYVGIRLAARRENAPVLRIALLGLLFVGVVQFSNIDLLSKAESSDAYSQVDHMALFGHVYDVMTDQSPARMVANRDDAKEHRFDQAAESHRRNSTAMLGLYSADLYASVYSQTVDDFRIDLAIPQNTDLQSHHLYANNSRAGIEALLGVKYFLQESGSKAPKFYGCDELVATESFSGANELGWSADDTIECKLWETQNVLPFAFTYDAHIPLSDYDQASPMRRQVGLLQGCAVESSSTPIANVDDASVEAPYSVVEDQSDGVTVEPDGTISCTKNGGVLVLAVEGVPQAETYVYLDNMNFEMYWPSELVTEEDRANLGPLAPIKLFIDDHRNYEAKDYRLTFKNGEARTAARSATPHGNFYTGKHTWLVNTGYREKPCKKISIGFQRAGRYTLDDLKIYCLPMKGFDDQVAARAADPTTVEFGTNAITGTVEAPATRLLFVSVPYSKGWSATLDGAPIEVKKANSGFMAIEVPAGSHEFAFAYETPYLKAGLIISLAGILAVAAIVLFNRKRRSA